jgi:hypothetical protein
LQDKADEFVKCYEEQRKIKQEAGSSLVDKYVKIAEGVEG